MPKRARTYFAFAQHNAMLLLAVFVLFANTLAAQNPPCSDFDIKFLQSNVLACDEQAVFYVEEGGITPPPSALTFGTPNASGFTFSSSNYDPGMGTLTFFDVAISSYKKFGTFTANVFHAGGVCEISGKVVECCTFLDPPYLLVVDEDITDQTSATTITGQVIFMGDVTFAANSYTFNAANIFLGPDAQLLPEINADFTIRNSSLEPFCDCRWDRILLADATNTLTMEGTTVRGALRGIHATTAVATSLKTNFFYDNFISLYIENSTGTGPYNGSYFKVDGCTFDVLNNTDPEIGIYCYDDQQSSVNMTTIMATTCQPYLVTDVIINGASDNVHIGHESYSMNQFKNSLFTAKKHLSCNNSQAYVRNNQFATGHFCGLNDARLFVGGTVPQMNIFNGTLSEFTSSAAILQNNSYTDGSVSFTDPTNATVPGGSAAGSEMAYNDFTDADILIDGNNGSVRFRVFDNYMDNTPTVVKEMSSTSSTNKMIFHSNYLEKSTTGAIVKIDDCNKMLFANNFIEHISYYVPSTGGASYIGVNWEDTEDATASNNEFQNCSYGFNIKGSNLGTQFTCNEFLNSYHAFYLDNYPTISNQGSGAGATDNCYKYAYSGSVFPFAEQIGGFYNDPTNWYVRSSISCTLPQPFASCYCTVVDNTNITFLSIQTGTAITCTIPPSNKTALIEIVADKQMPLYYYPNPVSTALTLEFDTPTAFSIYNLQGQQIFAQNAQTNAVVNVREWPDGTYIIHTATQSGKFVVRK